jgi:hypothetical protein
MKVYYKWRWIYAKSVFKFSLHCMLQVIFFRMNITEFYSSYSQKRMSSFT